MGEFQIKKREPLTKPAYIRLRDDSWDEIKRLSKAHGVPKSSVVQQCIDFALGQIKEPTQ